MVGEDFIFGNTCMRKIVANFDSATRIINLWIIEE